MTNHDFNSRILEHTDQRPWRMPDSPWVMTQTWNDLLFAHWPMSRDQLRSKVPDAFEIDLFDNLGWVGVVPFHMSNVGLRGVPSLPGTSAFPEHLHEAERLPPHPAQLPPLLHDQCP